MHARMWVDRLRGERAFDDAVAELWPYALGVLEPERREALAEAVGLDPVDAVERGAEVADWPALWDEMTLVRRSAPSAAW